MARTRPGSDARELPPPAVIDVGGRLRREIPQLSPAEQKVAQLMSEDPGRVAQMTVTELAAHASVSTATVVRATKSLGFAGYPQLRYALATQAGRTDAAGAVDVPPIADILDGDGVATIVAKLAAFECNQIVATSELTSPLTLDEIAGRVAAATCCYAFGIGSSGLVAQDFIQKITRIGLTGTAQVEHDAALVTASLLGPGDIVLAVSHSGETPGTIEPVRRAQQAGAFTAALTGAPRSTLARLAEQVLLTAGVEIGLRSAAVGSRIGQLLVIDALFVRIAQLTPTASAALQNTHDVIAAARKRGR